VLLITASASPTFTCWPSWAWISMTRPVTVAPMRVTRVSSKSTLPATRRVSDSGVAPPAPP
jgi:hypothetical protein